MTSKEINFSGGHLAALRKEGLLSDSEFTISPEDLARRAHELKKIPEVIEVISMELANNVDTASTVHVLVQEMNNILDNYSPEMLADLHTYLELIIELFLATINQPERITECLMLLQQHLLTGYEGSEIPDKTIEYAEKVPLYALEIYYYLDGKAVAIDELVSRISQLKNPES